MWGFGVHVSISCQIFKNSGMKKSQYVLILINPDCIETNHDTVGTAHYGTDNIFSNSLNFKLGPKTQKC